MHKILSHISRNILMDSTCSQSVLIDFQCFTFRAKEYTDHYYKIYILDLRLEI